MFFAADSPELVAGLLGAMHVGAVAGACLHHADRR